MSFVSAAGAELFTIVERSPRKGAPWLMLSNSLAADHSMWDGQISALSERYNVIRYDTRGHGRSTAPLGPYSFDRLVGDVVAILDHHGVERASFMGLSLGGMTGLGLAIAHANRLNRLVCCDARADAPEGFVKGWDERLATIDASGMAGLVKGTLERWLSPGFRAGDPKEAARIERMILATPVAGWKGCAEALKRLDYLKDLGRIAIPTLFVVGSDDMGAPVAVMQEMASRVAGARLAVIAGSHHLPNVDNASAFNTEVLAFLNGS